MKASRPQPSQQRVLRIMREYVEFVEEHGLEHGDTRWSSATVRAELTLFTVMAEQALTYYRLYERDYGWPEETQSLATKTGVYIIKNDYHNCDLVR